jgi:hypothetical protein
LRCGALGKVPHHAGDHAVGMHITRRANRLYFGKDKGGHRPIMVNDAITPVKAVDPNTQFLSRSSRIDIILMFILNFTTVVVKDKYMPK